MVSQQLSIALDNFFYFSHCSFHAPHTCMARTPSLCRLTVCTLIAHVRKRLPNYLLFNVAAINVNLPARSYFQIRCPLICSNTGSSSEITATD